MGRFVLGYFDVFVVVDIFNYFVEVGFIVLGISSLNIFGYMNFIL